MLKIESTTCVSGLKTILFIIASCLGLFAAVPEGWQMAGSKPADYDSAVDPQVVYDGRPSAYLRYALSSEPKNGDFGTLMQSFDAKAYIGQRVRFSGNVRSDAVQSWAGLWMRVDKERKMVAFDNMQNRAIKGTTGWRLYEVVLDVPEGSTGIFLGILLDGKGAVWLNNAKFEIVTNSVPITGMAIGDGPVNLSFDK